MRVLGIIVVVVSVLMVWFSSGDHPLYSPDEVRYGSVSKTMVETGQWIVPQIRGHAHLTKPPMTYWAEAVAMKVLGVTDLAVRLPSLVATSLTALLLFGIAWRMGGVRVGVAATALFSVMPLVFGIGRTAITDPVLNLFWLSTLVCGYLLIETHKRRWMALLWIAAALGLFTKGPVALTPVGVVLIWLSLGRRWRDIGRMWVPIGLPMAFTPLLAWVFAVYRLHPDAFAIWKYEILDRVSGSGDHPQPIWYYAPVFLIGLIPATMMLMAPGWNFRWKEGWTQVRSATPIALWALAIVVPFVMYSLISGKLTTYMLPIAAPLALLTALMLEEWMAGRADHRAKGRRWPDVVVTHTILTVLAATGAIVAAVMVNKPLIPAAAGLVVIPIASAIAWFYWKRAPKRRPALLALMWSGWVVAYGWIALAENNLRTTTDPRNLIATVQAVAADQGLGLSDVVFYGFYDPAFGFYTDEEYVVAGSAQQLGELADEHARDGLIVLADLRTWAVLLKQSPEMESRFTIEKETRRWVTREMLILSLNTSPGAME